MAQKIWLGSTALAAALLAGQVAQADLTPDQVWSQWQGVSQGTGRTVTTGQIDHAPDGLVVHDVDLTTTREKARSVIHLDAIRFRQRGDGSVAVFGPHLVTLSVTTGTDKGLTLDVHTGKDEGPMAIVSGSPEDMTIDTPKGDRSLRIDHVAVDGKPVDMTAELGLNGVGGAMHLTKSADGQGQDFSGTSTLESLSVSAQGQSPKAPAQTDNAAGAEDVTHFDLQAGMTGVTSQISGSLPNHPAGQDDGAFPLVMLHMDGKTGPGTLAVNLDSAKGPASFEASFDGTDMSQDVKPQGGAYRFDQRGLKLQIKAANMPVPQAGISLDHLGLGMKMPLKPADQAQDASLSLALDGFGLSPEIWRRLDPQAQLSHDPASLDLDLSGKVRLLLNLLDPKVFEKAASQGKPLSPEEMGSLDALTLDKLHLSAVGAELDGHGSVTFDHTKPGAPEPIGSVDLSAKGLQSLIDTLGAMGILPKDKSAGAMMMLALFARPGDGPDSLVSQIEFKTGGTIYVNGQRIR